MRTNPSVTLAVTIPTNLLTGPAGSFDVSLTEQLVARISRTGSGRGLPAASHRVPNTLRYAAVHTASPKAEEVHAAINRTINNRSSTARFTLCDRKGLRVVTGLRHEPLEVVTCKQCRKQLVEDGVLDEL